MQTPPNTPAGTREIELITQVLSKRLQEVDIERILSALCTSDQEQFMSRVADLLLRVSALLDAYHRISEFGSVDLLLDRLTQIMSEVLHAERTSIFLHDPESNDLFARVTLGDRAHEIRCPARAGIPGVVFTTGEGLIIDEACSDSRFDPCLNGTIGCPIFNLLCIPLRHHRKKIIGVTLVVNKQGGPFTAEDQAILEAVTTHAAAALENARNHEMVEKVRREEVTLLEITTAICTELQLDPLLGKITEVAAKILDAERGTVFVHDPQSKTLWTRAATGLEGSRIQIPETAGIAGLVFSCGQSLHVPDAYADPRFNPAVDSATGYRTRNILSMPIINKSGRVIGVTQVLNKRKGPFNSEDERRLRALTAQAAIALENARLHHDLLMQERIRRDLSTARQIQQGFLPTTVPSFCDGVLDLIGELHPAQEVSGDFYDYIALDERRLALVVADVSGKGMPAALFMTIVRTYLRELVRTESSPGRVLALLNDALARDNPAFMFVTVVLGICDVPTGHCLLARAGHPPPILKKQNGALLELTQAKGSLLGIQSPCAALTEISIDLDPGDCLIFYTDGATEASEPLTEELFGAERLLQAVRTIPPENPLPEWCQSIRGQIQAFTRTTEFEDDLTLLLVRRSLSGGQP